MNQKGITLIELLAVIILLGVITSSIFGLLISGNQNYERQTDENQQLDEISYVLKQVTKDIRQSNVASVKSNTFTLDSITYHFDRNTQTLKRNGRILSSTIKSFQVTQEGKQIVIEMTSNLNKSIQTTVFLRSEE
nr:prepilin-type N-terminal cleavage/methylation domain-containing protein [Lysinibacillus timonensis]